MAKIELGRLERVDLRTVWKHEAHGFTPWLSQSENLLLLGDTIGLELTTEAQEKNIGPFRADLVCRDTASGSLVLIENQLERTDHNHLGQLMTYAAGLDAVTVVWIAERFTPEHRATLDWLNEITIPKVNFFGLELELWRIGNSPPAPKFNLASQPNEWTKGGGGSEGASDTALLRQEYWRALSEHLLAKKSFLKAQKPLPQAWTNFAIGRSHFYLSAWVNGFKNRVGVSLIIDGQWAKDQFAALHAQKADIEIEAGRALEWRELTDKKVSQIRSVRDNSNPDDQAAWPAQHDWFVETLEVMRKVFAPRVKVLPSSYENSETANGE